MSRNIYLGHQYSPPLLQNCTSERAGSNFERVRAYGRFARKV